MAQQARPPIVAILGHVDHGKTSLLDHIRQTRVQAGEFGGITQHIGAYQAQYQGKAITFIDTPGHAAFSKMRSRGAAVTDIVLLVVAADDGVKPQTVESIQHIKKSQAPFIVVINKMDTAGASPDMVKAQLTEHEVYVAGYGGDTEVVEVSAKTGAGVDDLLETIVTMGELAELKGDPDAELNGVVIESSKDKFLGSIATVLVRNGTLSLKDQIWAGDIECQVRTMTDALGIQHKQAGPSFPVQITGFSDVPAVGSVVSTTSPQAVEAEIAHPSLANLLSQLEDQPKLRLVLKADVAGTLEAIRQNIPSENVEFIHLAVGDVNESDVSLAETAKAAIVAFQVGVPGPIKKLALHSGVKIKQYKIIYELLEDIQERILRLLEPTINEEILAEAEVLQLFNIRGEQILGCKVESGILRRAQNIHLKRGDQVVADGTISSLKQGKTDVESVEAGLECGVVLVKHLEVEPGDKLIAFKVAESSL